MKRLLAIALCTAALALLAGGCGDDTSTATGMDMATASNPAPKRSSNASPRPFRKR